MALPRVASCSLTWDSTPAMRASSGTMPTRCRNAWSCSVKCNAQHRMRTRFSSIWLGVNDDSACSRRVYSRSKAHCTDAVVAPPQPPSALRWWCRAAT